MTRLAINTRVRVNDGIAPRVGTVLATYPDRCVIEFDAVPPQVATIKNAKIEVIDKPGHPCPPAEMAGWGG